MIIECCLILYLIPQSENRKITLFIPILILFHSKTHTLHPNYSRLFNQLVLFYFFNIFGCILYLPKHL